MSVTLTAEQMSVLRMFQKYDWKSDLANSVFGEMRDYPDIKLKDVKRLFKDELRVDPSFQQHYEKAKDFMDVKGTVRFVDAPKDVKPVEIVASKIPRQKDAVPAGKSHRLSRIVELLRSV